VHPNERLLTRFYDAFAKRDAKTMASCYADDVRFSDRVFPDLHGPEVMRMWRMLAATGAGDLVLKVEGVVADDNAGTARWSADYTFTRTGRKVHNEITTHVEVKGGRIVRQVDSFSFWRWSRQALGPVGWLLGWTPIVRNKVRREAAGRLAAFAAKEAEAAPTPAKRATANAANPAKAGKKKR